MTLVWLLCADETDEFSGPGFFISEHLDAQLKVFHLHHCPLPLREHILTTDDGNALRLFLHLGFIDCRVLRLGACESYTLLIVRNKMKEFFLVRSFIKKSQFVAICLSVVLASCSYMKQPEEKTTNALSATLLELAQSAEANFDYSAAAGHYNQLYTREPDNIDAVLGTARNMRYAGVANDSVKQLNAAIKRHGKTPALVLELSKSQLTAARINDSWESINSLANKGALKWQFLAVEALIHDRLGQYKKAQNLYLKVLANSKEDISVSNNLALSYSLSGDLDKGIKILEALQLDSRSTLQTRQNLVMLLVLSGERDKAKRVALKDYTPEQAAQNLAAYELLSRHTKQPGEVRSSSAKKKPRLMTDDVILTEMVKPYIALKNSIVRYGPGRQFTSISFLRQGEAVKVMGRSKDSQWFLVALPKGEKGFVFHQLLKAKP